MEQLGGEVFAWFQTFAHEPAKVYLAATVMLVLSSFGLPIPEEVTLLSSGFLAFIGRSPGAYPPPAPGAPVVDPYVLATICTVAVFSSDAMMYWIGRKFGTRIRRSRRLGRIVSAKAWDKAEAWNARYGVRVCWIFRFTPGLRFPGHLTCGIVRVPFLHFVIADGIATLVSVPTQVLLIAFYGEQILAFLKEFKLVAGILLAVGVVVFLLSRLLRRRTAALPPAEPEAESADPTAAEHPATSAPG